MVFWLLKPAIKEIKVQEGGQDEVEAYPEEEYISKVWGVDSL